MGQAEPFFGMFIVNIIMLYSLQYRYYQVCKIIFVNHILSIIHYIRSTTFELLIVTYWTGYIPHLIICIIIVELYTF